MINGIRNFFSRRFLYDSILGIILTRAAMNKISFTEHPESVGETYLEHMGQATFFGTRMIAAGLACLVHGLLPFFFTTTGSRTIALLHERMVTNRRRKSLPAITSEHGFGLGI